LNFFLPGYTRKINMIERVKEARNLNSLLLIYSESDKWMPVEMGKRFEKNSPVPTELWIVEKAEHAEIMNSEHKEAYCEKIIDYFNDEASKTTAAAPQLN